MFYKLFHVRLSNTEKEFILGVRDKLKKNSLLYKINASLKAKLQEHYVKKELNYYNRESVRKQISFLKGEDLSDALKDKSAKRNILRIPEQKGDLHIFLAYSLHNWEYILPIALKTFGMVTEFEWISHGFDHNANTWLQERDSMNEAMLQAFVKANSEKPVDLVVGYLSGYTVNPAILQKMRQTGAIIFNFNLDDKLWFRGKMCGGRWTGPASLASAVDLNLTNAPDSVIKYFVEGGLAMFWPEAGHPDIHKPYDTPFEYDVSFVGGKYGWRPKFIARLRKMGINITCFGNGWENGPLSDEEMVKLYSRSRINLGFAGVGHSKKLMCLKGRDFEVPMSGGLYLTQDNPELSLVYNVGKEIVTYLNEKDCTEKIRWLLANPDTTNMIRKAGRARALREHSWENRFKYAFKMCGVLE